MRQAYLPLLLAVLVVPFAQGHIGGTAGYPKPYCEGVFGDMTTHDYGGSDAGLPPLLALPNVDGAVSCGRRVPGDMHGEFRVGGTALMADPALTPFCYGELADHAVMPFVVVADTGFAALGVSTAFIVGVDAVGAPPCGDGIVDTLVFCVDMCVVPMLPGMDGAYHVFVTGSGTGGHVFA